jgi:hypothetical protein
MRSKRASIRLQVEELESRLVLSTYDVGPGQAYTALGQVDWNHLQAGDVVRIHWQPTPYHEKIQIAARGTQSAPIQIIGVAGPNGQLPVIDGDGAVSNPGSYFAYAPMEGAGGIIICPHGDEADPNYKAGYIDIENLDLENFSSSKSYTAADGTTHNYWAGSAGIAMYYAEDVTIHGCVIHGNDNGIFGKSYGYEQGTLRNILIDGNTIYGNGVVGEDRYHNSYLEGVGVTYQYNHYGPEIAGALGSDIKDRSAGTVIRYNWLEGGAHILDLVEAEDGGTIITSDPSNANTLVYGNVLYNPPNSSASLIHFGGDLGDPNYYRTNLYLYNNTIVNRDDQLTGNWHAELLQMETAQQTAWVRNNIIFNESATPGQAPTELWMDDGNGTINLSTNWISTGVLPSDPSSPVNGAINGLNQVLWGSDPGFVNDVSDFHLQANSVCLGQGVAIDPAVADHPVLSQYTPPPNDPLQPSQSAQALVRSAVAAVQTAVSSSNDLGGFQSQMSGGGPVAGATGGQSVGGATGGGQAGNGPTGGGQTSSASTTPATSSASSAPSAPPPSSAPTDSGVPATPSTSTDSAAPPTSSAPTTAAVPPTSSAPTDATQPVSPVATTPPAKNTEHHRVLRDHLRNMHLSTLGLASAQSSAGAWQLLTDGQALAQSTDSTTTTV